MVLIPVVAAQPIPGNEKISTDDLKEDLDILKDKLKLSEPGLYLYTSKDSLDNIFETIRGSIQEPMTSIEFYRRIAPLNRILRNLHTRLWPSAAYQKSIEHELPRFPLDIHWHDNKMYVLRNHSTDERIREGSIIRSINGESAESIFNRLLLCTMGDGFNETYPVAYASKNFGIQYAHLIGTPQRFFLELTAPDSSFQRIEVMGITAGEIHASRVSKYKQKYSQYGEDWEAWKGNKQPALRFEMKGEAAILTLRTFHTYSIEGNGQKYEEFLNDVFAHLAANHVKHLIIDLRNNHGGHDLVGMSLMSHLHDSTFYYYKRRSASVKPIGKSAKNGDVYEIIGRRAWIGKVTPAKQLYKGAVYVLMNGFSVSAAGEFIGHLKNTNRAIFIGEEAGGNPVIFIGGQSVPIDLPHTHITGSIPLILVEMNVSLKNSGRGVMPDHEVVPTMKDILDEKDVEMERALGLIPKN